MSTHRPVALVTSVSASITKFLVGLASLPTVWCIYRDQSSAGYPLIPHAIELFPSAMLMYYDILSPKAGAPQISLDAFRCLIEVMYIIMYMYFAPRNHRVRAIKWVSILVVCLAPCIMGPYFGTRVVYTRLFAVTISYHVGWLAAIVGPLGHIRELCITRNLNLFPIVLTCFQTLDGIVSIIDSEYSKDEVLFIPNAGGAALGLVQILLYMYFLIRQRCLPQLPVVDVELQQILPEAVSDASSDLELHQLPSPPAEEVSPPLAHLPAEELASPTAPPMPEGQPNQEPEAEEESKSYLIIVFLAFFIMLIFEKYFFS